MSEIVLRYPEGELPLTEVPATVGESGINIAPLMKQTGRVTLDHGFLNTAACSSAITYIDGDKGILRYRGYPIEQLAQQSTFLETSYLLIYGELPTAGALDEFKHQIRTHTMLHEDLRRFFDGFPRDAHPMPVLSSAVSALSTFYQDSLDPFDPQQVEISTIRLLAKLPTIAAYAYKKSIGQPFLYPDNNLSLVENFLRMSFGLPTGPYPFDDQITRALDVLLILHADHELNASTFTTRVVSGTLADMYGAVTAGIAALAGGALLGLLGALIAIPGATVQQRGEGEVTVQFRPGTEAERAVFAVIKPTKRRSAPANPFPSRGAPPEATETTTEPIRAENPADSSGDEAGKP